MAEDKKGFLLYADQIHSFEALNDREAGRLIKHLFRYVNDLNPVAPDKITQIAFEPIKHQLKRDLIKYQGKKKKYSDAGKASAEAKRLAKEQEKKSTSFNDVEKRSTKSTVTDSDNVIVTGSVNDNATDTVKTNYLRIREKMFVMPVSVYFKQNFQITLDNWKGEIPAEKILEKMDEDYVCYDFRDENHLRNTFKYIYEKLKKGNGTTTTKSEFGKDKNAASRAEADRQADEIIRQHLVERSGNTKE